jgi:hypothetical protein
MAAPVTFGPVPFTATAPVTHSPQIDITAQMNKGYVSYGIFVDCTPWTSADSIEMLVEFSPDGGTTWGWGAGGTATGGTHTGLGGSASPWPGVGGAMPMPDNFAFTNSGWPTTAPAQVLVRMTVSPPSTKASHIQATLS